MSGLFKQNNGQLIAPFVHETGHQFELLHDRYETYNRDPEVFLDPGLLPYAHGYVSPNEGGGGLKSYSLPADTPGDPMGVPGDEPSPSVAGPADARRTFNETRRIVANFRVAPCLAGGTQVRLQASNGQYVVALGNGGGAVVADRARPGAWGKLTLIDHNGGCVKRGDIVSLRTSDGFYLRAQRGGGLALDATASRATPWARSVLRRRRGGGAVRSGGSVTMQTHTGHYLWAEGGGGTASRADRRRPGTWGAFRVAGIR